MFFLFLFSLFLPPSLFLSVSFSIAIAISLSLSLSLSDSVSDCLSPPPPPSDFFSLCPSLCLCPSFCLCLSLSLPLLSFVILCVSLPPLPLSRSVSHIRSVSPPDPSLFSFCLLFFCVCLCPPPPSLFFCVCLCPHPPLSLAMYISILYLLPFNLFTLLLLLCFELSLVLFSIRFLFSVVIVVFLSLILSLPFPCSLCKLPKMFCLFFKVSFFTFSLHLFFTAVFSFPLQSLSRFICVIIIIIDTVFVYILLS